MSAIEVYSSLFISSFLSSTLLPGHSELTLTAFIILKKYPVIYLILFASIGNILGSILNWSIGYYLTNLKIQKGCLGYIVLIQNFLLIINLDFQK